MVYMWRLEDDLGCWFLAFTLRRSHFVIIIVYNSTPYWASWAQVSRDSPLYTSHLAIGTWGLQTDKYNFIWLLYGVLRFKQILTSMWHMPYPPNHFSFPEAHILKNLDDSAVCLDCRQLNLIFPSSVSGISPIMGHQNQKEPQISQEYFWQCHVSR